MKRQLSLKAIGFVAAAVVACGCGAPGDELDGDADTGLGVQSAEVVLGSGDFVDASGTVTVRIKTCGWTSPAQHPQTSCSVDTDFVLVGGGAEIEGQTHPGGFLTASYPDGNLTTWFAASKDHERPAPHRLRAYAIGIKLAGLTSTQLRRYMYVASSRSQTAQHPSVTAELPANFTLIGGGARSNYTGFGNMLTESYPDAFQWVASSKDHRKPDPTTVDAFAIGIQKGIIPGFGAALDVEVNSATTYSSSYGNAQLLTPVGQVVTGVGALATYDYGRMLTDIIPYFDNTLNTKQGVWASAKDQIVSDAGYLTAFVISVRRH